MTALKKTRVWVWALGWVAVGLVGVGGCSAPSDVGVTPGGAQDMAQARQQIEQGSVPNPDAITVEGMLSEHSIEIDAPDDAGLLYSTVRAAWNDDFDAFTPHATLAVGFGTTIDADTFSRDPINLCLVIDRSGSMNDIIDQRTRTDKLTAVKIAIDRLLSNLTGNDRVSIVAFDFFASTLLEGARGNDLASIKTALDQIQAEGATNILRGMNAGYAAALRQSGAGRSDRIIVFTDALPTAGASESADFLPAMRQRAAEGIGTTLFGVGVNFGNELAYDISQVRGGNYFFLGDYERIVTVFDEDFDFLVTPIAYDVSLQINVPFSFDVAGVYGLPDSTPLTHALELKVATLFLSSREGGGSILVRLRPGAQVDFSKPVDLGQVTLTWADKLGLTTTETHDSLLPAGLPPNASSRYFEDAGVHRAVLLLNTALVMKAAIEDVNPSSYFYFGYQNCQLSVDRLSEFVPYFDSHAVALEDQPSPTSRSLSQERTLVIKLLENISGRCGIRPGQF